MNHFVTMFSRFNYALLTSLILLAGCGKSDDPAPVNEEEVITTIAIMLKEKDAVNMTPISLLFYDEDGEVGEINPIITISGPMKANTVYNATISVKNQTEDADEDITGEISEEAQDHLFCFTSSGTTLDIEYDDKDANNLPLGLKTVWTTGDAGTENINVVLRHQPGTKTGECPGTGESDLDVTFENVVIQ